ncbi:SRPBCC domain-containing protein [Agromyces sp. NPDC056965]|uniref:SRPBCC family protein n=1 Tax=Agromyces sp. NPDC056965 TaxID=3345983 RepID=UPI0036454805
MQAPLNERPTLMNDFTTSVTINRPVEDVFKAVLDARGWWNEAIDGPTAEVGDEFGFEVPGLHRTRMRITDVEHDRRIIWLVVDNFFAFVEDQSEWVGDRIQFDIAAEGDGARVTFTQHGLVPDLECYDVCSNAWVFFVRESLRRLAEDGEGMPESSAGQAAPASRARSAVDALTARSGSAEPSS